jgi:hypothetical protein
VRDSWRWHSRSSERITVGNGWFKACPPLLLLQRDVLMIHACWNNSASPLTRRSCGHMSCIADRFRWPGQSANLNQAVTLLSPHALQWPIVDCDTVFSRHTVDPWCRVLVQLLKEVVEFFWKPNRRIVHLCPSPLSAQPCLVQVYFPAPFHCKRLHP